MRNSTFNLLICCQIHVYYYFVTLNNTRVFRDTKVFRKSIARDKVNEVVSASDHFRSSVTIIVSQSVLCVCHILLQVILVNRQYFI